MLSCYKFIITNISLKYINLTGPGKMCEFVGNKLMIGLGESPDLSRLSSIRLKDIQSLKVPASIAFTLSADVKINITVRDARLYTTYNFRAVLCFTLLGQYCT